MIKEKDIKLICKHSSIALSDISFLKTSIKNEILIKISQKIRENCQNILNANKIDVKLAKKLNLDDAKIDRLVLTEERISSIADSVYEISKLDDPIGKISYDISRDNGLNIKRISTPIGLIMAIYESRPNVTSDISALCIKSSNGIILKSGKESFNSSKAIADIYRLILSEYNLDPNIVTYIENTDRDSVKYLLKMDDYIDVVIPRGGKNLIRAISKNTKIPIFKHLDGNCHTYIEKSAELNKAIAITLNAKLRRVGICGATESLLIDSAIAKEFLEKITDELIKNGCEIRGCAKSQKIDKRIKKANEKDFYEEYLDRIISVKIVKDIKEAISHINKYSSSHTESIICEDEKAKEEFFLRINSAIVMHNASTQFADGGEFGLGAEVGISTGKLHARGPVGLEQLTTYKYIIDSECAIRK